MAARRCGPGRFCPFCPLFCEVLNSCFSLLRPRACPAAAPRFHRGMASPAFRCSFCALCFFIRPLRRIRPEGASCPAALVDQASRGALRGTYCPAPPAAAAEAHALSAAARAGAAKRHGVADGADGEGGSPRARAAVAVQGQRGAGARCSNYASSFRAVVLRCRRRGVRPPWRCAPCCHLHRPLASS